MLSLDDETFCVHAFKLHVNWILLPGDIVTYRQCKSCKHVLIRCDHKFITANLLGCQGKLAVFKTHVTFVVFRGLCHILCSYLARFGETASSKELILVHQIIGKILHIGK